MSKKSFKHLVNSDFPIIMAPMFLVSNTKMMIEALKNGITAAIPALNFRTIEQLKEGIIEIKNATSKPFGINLIVNKSNILYPKQLRICLENKIDFIITSLGNPEEVIEQCKPLGIKIFCDVTTLDYAKKVEALGADALIAIGSEAGGHCGPESLETLVPKLVKNCKIPVIAAGGITKKTEVDYWISKGAVGVSVGTIFIASEECSVSQEYKQALIEYTENDIVLTTKISGSKLTVINTPYVQKNGIQASWLEKFLTFKPLRKYVKMIISIRGLNKIKKSATSATYQTYFVAGQSIKEIKQIRSLSKIIQDLI